MPATLEVYRQWQAAPAVIAEGLLAADVLQELDWCGHLDRSIQAGLSRWWKEAGGEGFKHMNLRMVYADDSDNLELANGCHAFGFLGVGEHGRIGAFGLVAEAWDAVCVEKRVRSLETLARGAGFAVMGLVEEALNRTIGVAGPGWAHEEIQRQIDTDTPSEEDLEYWREQGYVTPETFLQRVPIEAVNCRWQRKPVEKALRAARRSQPEWAPLLEGALALADVFESGGGKNENFVGALDEQSVLPVILRWNDEDDIVTYVDEYHDLLSQAEYTEIVFLRPFDALDACTGEHSVHEAIDSIKRVMEILTRVDSLLHGLHHTDKLKDILA